MVDYTKIFQISSQQTTNTVKNEIIPNLLRQAGHTLTDEEGYKIIARFKDEDVSLEQFLEIADDMKKNVVNVEKIRAAFRLYDCDDIGFINVGTLKALLRDECNELDDLEIEEIVRIANPDGDGRINYEALLKTLG